MLELLPFFKVFFLIFSSDTTGPILTKLGMNVPLVILHRTAMVSFDPLKNMANVTKRRLEESESSLFCIYLQKHSILSIAELTLIIRPSKGIKSGDFL